MRMDGVGLCRAYVSPAAGFLNASSRNRLGKFLWTGNSSVVPDTRSDDVWGM